MAERRARHGGAGAAVVAAVAVAALGVLVTATTARTATVEARVTATGEVTCLQTSDDELCLGGVHDVHLSLGRLTAGACAHVEYVGAAPSALTTRAVRPSPCEREAE